MNRLFICALLTIGIIVETSPLVWSQELVNYDPGEQMIRFDLKKGTVYQMINRLSDITGYYFVYDSELINNDRKVRINPGDYKLKDLIREITGNNVDVKLQDKYLLLFISKGNTEITSELKLKSSADSVFIVKGKLLDRITGEPVVYGTIDVACGKKTTVSNQDGNFMLKLPDSLQSSVIRISHIGYLNRMISADVIAGKNIDIYLDQKIIPLQEIVVRMVDPKKVLREMLKRRQDNYNSETAYLTSFFREGIENRHGFNLTEAVLKIYKTGIHSTLASEQVKILKMRRLGTPNYNDSLIVRLKSSIYSCQMLDIIKNLPDFLDPQYYNYYNYSHTDITVLDERRVLVFFFEQKEEIKDPLFMGKLYIDAENYALLKATFQINPLYVEDAADILVLKQSRHIKAIPQSAIYEVSYAPVDGKYYLNHVRADLTLKMKKRGSLFSSNEHVWFEMANCETNTSGVKRFANEEIVSNKNFLSEVSYSYDEAFWGNFNTLLPEKSLKELIRKYNFDIGN